MYRLKSELNQELAELRRSGLYKHERSLRSAQSVRVTTTAADGTRAQLLNFCSNNYLGLADDQRLTAAAVLALNERGLGMASVRFICGTQDLHLALEERISELLGTEDTILFPSCFDANGGVFEALLGPEDAVVSDTLNHASIIDGIRLSKAHRFRYQNRDLADLRHQLQKSQSLNDGAGARRLLIVTDGVFSMDGYLAPLPDICDLAEEFGALVMVDDSHAVGFMGATGAGTPEHLGVSDRVDIFTGTLGKALGGAAGGYVSGHAEIVQTLRQRARPYLFSNSLPPAMVNAAIAALDIVPSATQRRERLRSNAAQFRTRMAEEGFDLLPGEHPIIAVMFYDASFTAAMADQMFSQGVHITAFSHPVVPHGKARIRIQLTSEHTAEDIDTCVQAFVRARKELVNDEA